MNESNGKGNWSKVAEECRNRYNETNHSVTGFSPKYLLSVTALDANDTLRGRVRYSYFDAVKMLASRQFWVTVFG
ncbi:hypothetical protein EVAR_95726_1 [Eumeta japonica]|uniref:Uncharacterized protein n=1 Tax=Eumeta variegata TaxID=151549 RepID=A0A4C1UL98_EUMVA|nr:hypothetical protein EVAR_95726_1 [Eumeta japonica]